MVGGGGRAGKGEANGGVCGDGSFVLRLRQRRCEPTHAINGCKPPHTRRRHQSPGFDFALRLQKFNHWGKLGEGYVEPPCIIFATFYESILIIKKKDVGTCLVVWWLRLCISTAGGMGSIPGQRTKIPNATWCRQIKKKKKKMYVLRNQLHINQEMVWEKFCYSPVIQFFTFLQHYLPEII